MKQTYTDKDYFDEKFNDIDKQFKVINELLNGNGKPGLINRIEVLEEIRNRALGIFAAIGIGVFLIGVYVRGFFEDIYKHLYGK